jgi:hypothetical protein
MTDAEEVNVEVNLDLSNVLPRDYSLVRDVCAVLATVCKSTSRQALDNITVCTNADIYFITASFLKGYVIEFSKAELDTICDVNPLRVLCISMLYDGERVNIKVKVASYDHPLTITNTDIVRIVKKRKWINFLST